MFSRGAKLFFGLAAVAYVGALVYGVITNGLGKGGVVTVLSGDGAVDAVLGPLTIGYKGGVGEHVGYTMLMAFAVSSVGMGIASLAFRDGDPEALAELANSDAVPPVSEPNDLSQWPIVTAFSLTLMTLGLAVGPLLFAIGAGALAISAFEWSIKAWSERATGDPEVNRTIRNRLMYPVELPVAGLALAAIVVYCFSRILLSASKSGALIIATVIGLVIFTVAVGIGTRPQIRRAAVVGAVLLGAVAVLAVGIIGALRGESAVEHHEEGHALVVPSIDSSLTALVGETATS